MKILLLGGSKSGKSGLAQCLARNLAGTKALYYWATMEPTDAEDQARIRRHLRERAGWGFQTVEQGRDLPRALHTLDGGGTVLLDSVTALLANEMFGLEMDLDAPKRVTRNLLQLGNSVANLVCVCDDLFRDAGRYDPMTEEYRRGLAQICRSLASEFDVTSEVLLGKPKAYRGKAQLQEVWKR